MTRYWCAVRTGRRAAAIAALAIWAGSGALGQEGEEPRERFRWREATLQSSLFLAIQHAFRLLTEPDTRAQLKGPFWRDYGRAVRGIRGWGDGDPFLVNYVGHPFEGAVAGYIQTHNDPDYRRAQFGASQAYWRSRLRAMGWAALHSTQFELGPLSEASIGNVGLRPGTSGVCDLVTTPLAGVGVMIAEDALDRYVVRVIERRFANPFVRIVARGMLNPNRSFANLMRGKVPWHRDSRQGAFEP
jgi:hypothetical protein